jgi:hypothetical protein
MDRALDSDEPPGDGSHIGGELPYILAGLGAVWLVSMGLMAANSFLDSRRQHMEAQRDIERLQVVQGGIVTLETLDSTSPAENYKLSQSSELHPILQSQALDTLELWSVTRPYPNVQILSTQCDLSRSLSELRSRSTINLQTCLPSTMHRPLVSRPSFHLSVMQVDIC